MRQGKAEAGAVQRVRGDREPEITRRQPGTTERPALYRPKSTAPPIREPMTWPKGERREHGFTEAWASEARKNSGPRNRQRPINTEGKSGE